jgi:simple sugar transport system permease protein
VNRTRFSDAAFSLGVSLATVVLALAISAVLIAATGGDAFGSLKALWDGAFGNRTQLAGTLAKMIPLSLVALGWIVAFSTRRINIGFEGQILVGGVFAAFVGLQLGPFPAPLHLGLGVLLAVAGGAAYAGIAAWLWARRGVNEIISTLMLNFVAIQLVSWLVRGPLQEPTHTFPRTAPIPVSALWPKIIPLTSFGFDVILALLVLTSVWVMLSKTAFGFRLRLTGANEMAARHAGVATVRVTVAAMLASGGLAGLAGASLILSSDTMTMADNFSASYGFTGIVVALLARNSPAGVLPAALLFSFLRQGGGLMEAREGISAAVVLITQALVILLVAAAGFMYERRRGVRVDAMDEAGGHGVEVAGEAGWGPSTSSG